MDLLFLYMTKPSLLAFHGSIAPCPGIHAVAFLCYEHNPTVSKPLRYSHCWEQCSSPAGTCRKPVLKEKIWLQRNIIQNIM